MRKGCHFS